MKKILFLVLVLVSTAAAAKDWSIVPYNIDGNHLGYVVATTANNSNSSILIIALNDGSTFFYIEASGRKVEPSQVRVVIDGEKAGGDVGKLIHSPVDGLWSINEDMLSIMVWLCSVTDKYELIYPGNKKDVFDFTGFRKLLYSDTRLVNLRSEIEVTQAKVEQHYEESQNQ